MKYCVYILYSEKWRRYYVGQTQNFEARLNRHNNGIVKSTKGGIPWTLKKKIVVESRCEAMKLER
ncbi:MAG TPA: GIY-YIG nuclease family protein, partial [Lutibacter sp.]|nr:GIY-YIG nuclease family protein [Lutibacter sp.]